MDRRLVKILADVFRLREGEITAELTKDKVGSWDSLRQMDLVVSLESEYGVRLEIEDIIRMQSVGVIIEVLREKGVCFEN